MDQEARHRATTARRWWVLVFLIPTLLILSSLVLYPALRTITDSFLDRFGDQYIGLENYSALASSPRFHTAVLNSFLWATLFPLTVVTIGLVLAVLIEKVRWETAFKLVLFLPVAVSAMSSGIVWRMMLDDSPERGAFNAVATLSASIVSPAGDLAGARPTTGTITLNPDGSIAFPVEVSSAGAVANLGLIGIAEVDLPGNATTANPATRQPKSITGTIWRDAGSSNGQKGKIDKDEIGLSGILVKLISPSGSTVAQTYSVTGGRYAFEGIAPGKYSVLIPSEVTRTRWTGIEWLSPSLITPAAMLAGLWIWAGFSLVMIRAAMTRLDRDVTDAARIDGASEAQILRRITLPLLAPTLSVIGITLAIYGLKVFDLIIGIAPEPVQDDANVIALEMWRSAFTGLGNRGLGSAAAVIMFVMVVPVVALSLRSFRGSETRT